MKSSLAKAGREGEEDRERDRGIIQASLVAQLVKNPPEKQETWVRSLCWEDALEKGMATHSSVLAWRMPTDRGVWRAAVNGVAQRDSNNRIPVSTNALHS